MDYILEFGKNKSIGNNVIFINIIGNGVKINVIERYESWQSLDYGFDVKEAFFRVRNLNDEIILNKNSNVKNKIKGDDFKKYYVLSKNLNNARGRNKDFEKAYIDFIIEKYNENYS
jgi:hypothetical protein